MLPETMDPHLVDSARSLLQDERRDRGGVEGWVDTQTKPYRSAAIGSSFVELGGQTLSLYGLIALHNTTQPVTGDSATSWVALYTQPAWTAIVLPHTAVIRSCTTQTHASCLWAL